VPYLSRYMGHATFDSAYYYVHTSPDFMDAYAQITQKSQSLLPEARQAATRRRPAGETATTKWNLRLAAANRGIWKASELQRMLAEAGLVISAGKMSGLWSGSPASIKLDDLDIICAVLGCGVEELLIPAPQNIQRPAEQHDQPAAASSSPGTPVTPRRRDGRSLPPA